MKDSFSEDDNNPVHDLEFGFDSDSTPVEVLSAVNGLNRKNENFENWQSSLKLADPTTIINSLP